MIKLVPSTADEVDLLREWIEKDSYHAAGNYPEWWLTGRGLLTFCTRDDAGPVAFFRTEDEGDYIRIFTQFGPPDVVSKHRIAAGIIKTVNILKKLYASKKGLVFKTVNPQLGEFTVKSLEFKAVGNDEYRFDFEG